MTRIVLLLIFSLALLVGCGPKHTPENPKVTQHIKGSAFSLTENGYYTAEFVFRPRQPVTGKNKGHLIVHNYRSIDVPGMKISIVPYLPAKGLTSPETPGVKDMGRGLYLVENIYFPEPGKWVFKMQMKGMNQDRVTLEIPGEVK